MTDTQRKWLTEYLGECWKGDIIDGICERCGTIFSTNRTFTTAQDKQDLLMKVIEKGEWAVFTYYVGKTTHIDFDRIELTIENFENDFLKYNINTITAYSSWLIRLSPEATAELICKWKGVE